MSNEPHDLPSMECFKAADALVTFKHGPSLIADRNRIAEIIQHYVFTVPLVKQHPQWLHDLVESKAAAARERTASELYEAAKEAIVEIEYWHEDMLSPEERAHPRGSGWARVHDSLSAALAAAREAWGWEE